jgi:hypothetical protein
MMQTTGVIGFLCVSIIVAAEMTFASGMDTVIKLYDKRSSQAATYGRQ